MSYYGKSPEKPSILLNSHTDVVPADQVNIKNYFDLKNTLFIFELKKYWNCDPFEGKIDENGNIIGRGSQDMKSVGIT